MKTAARKTIEKILWWQVGRLRRKNNIKLIAVAGSLGKTSTKLAIAKALESKYRVQYQEGNYNVPVSVPLIFFGHAMPSLFNPVAWFAIFIKNEAVIRQKFPYEVVIVELGTDAPGQLEAFVPLLRADIGVLTAIAPEHMEYFKTIEAVAEEEVTIARLSDVFIYNKDRCEKKYMDAIKGLTYAIEQPADLKLSNLKFSNGYNFEVYSDGNLFISAFKDFLSPHQLYSVAAAVLVAKMLGLEPEDIKQGIERIQPVSGRMQKLQGINNSTIIDDTYNASPAAVAAALDTLYRLQSSSKIAVIGNMNELGDHSEQAHREIGKKCDPRQLELLITIGPDANKYLAEEAEKNGCKLMRFEDPYSIGDYLKDKIKENSIILFKGSQNKVFAEEAIKAVLADPADASKLVRQSEYWMKRKKANFKR